MVWKDKHRVKNTHISGDFSLNYEKVMTKKYKNYIIYKVLSSFIIN